MKLCICLKIRLSSRFKSIVLRPEKTPLAILSQNARLGVGSGATLSVLGHLSLISSLLTVMSRLATPWTAAAGSSVHGFPRQELWSGLPFPFPGGLPNPGVITCSSCWAGGFFTAKAPEPIFMDGEGGLAVMTEFRFHFPYQGAYSNGDSNLKIHRILKPTYLQDYFPNDFIRNILQTAYVGII